MAEKEEVFTSKVEYAGIFSFKDFYQFCYKWLTEETGLDLSETKYEEKIVGDKKNIEIKWSGKLKITDYFRFDAKIVFKTWGLTKVEIQQDNTKIQTNKGQINIKVSGILVRDYLGKFEKNAIQKFLRSIYEKWIIPTRIDQFQTKIISDCDEFLDQAKAYLDLEGKK